MKEKTEILFALDHNIDSIGGAQYSSKIIMDLLKNKYSFGVVQPGVVINKQNNIHYYELTKYKSLKEIVKHPYSLFKYIKELICIIKSERPNIIHTQSQVNFFIIAFLKKSRFISKNTFLIHTERGLYTKYSNFINNLFLYLMPALNILVTTTEFNMKYWKQALNDKNIELDSYEIIENTAGSIFEEFDETYPEKFPEQIVIGFAGRYADWKNWPLAVDIALKLDERFGEQVVLKMAVSDDGKDEMKDIHEMFSILESRMGKRFEGKINVAFEEMNSFYYDIDIFILTSIKNSESFGRTLVEAMSRKSVVLTTDAGGSVEVVGNSDFVMNTAEEFVSKIREFIENPNYLNFEKEKSFNRVKQKYSLENNINKHDKMYSKYI